MPMIDLRHLPNEMPDEQVVYFLRAHPITILNLVLGWIVVIAAPPLGFWYLFNYLPLLVADERYFSLIVLAASAFFLFVWLFLFQAFMDYYLDIWIVTNKRILSIEQVGLFNRRISESRLYRVQDVTASVTGAWRTIFNYGDVEIQTAGEKERFSFESVPNPNMVSRRILQLVEEDRKEHFDEALEEMDAHKNKERPTIGRG